MIIAGVDPGSRVTGYSFMEKKQNRIKVLEYGVLRLPEKAELMERLGVLTKGFRELLSTYQPQVMSMESIFFAKNVRSAIVLAHARGAILATAQDYKVQFHEFAPRFVKQAVVGSGKAGKDSVAQMMQHHLGLKELPKPSDASDALALAWTYLTMERFL